MVQKVPPVREHSSARGCYFCKYTLIPAELLFPALTKLDAEGVSQKQPVCLFQLDALCARRVLFAFQLRAGVPPGLEAEPVFSICVRREDTFFWKPACLHNPDGTTRESPVPLERVHTQRGSAATAVLSRILGTKERLLWMTFFYRP